MKSTAKQLKVIEFLQQQLKFWKNTNDIGSPTHVGDISQFSQFFSDILHRKKLKILIY